MKSQKGYAHLTNRHIGVSIPAKTRSMVQWGSGWPKYALASNIFQNYWPPLSVHKKTINVSFEEEEDEGGTYGEFLEEQAEHFARTEFDNVMD